MNDWVRDYGNNSLSAQRRSLQSGSLAVGVQAACGPFIFNSLFYVIKHLFWKKKKAISRKARKDHNLREAAPSKSLNKPPWCCLKQNPTATLHVRMYTFIYAQCPSAVLPEPTRAQSGKPAVSVEVNSPVCSDEEYLSPQEEPMELGDYLSPKGVCMKEPPSFQVTLAARCAALLTFMYADCTMPAMTALSIKV